MTHNSADNGACICSRAFHSPVLNDGARRQLTAEAVLAEVLQGPRWLNICFAVLVLSLCAPLSIRAQFAAVNSTFAYALSSTTYPVQPGRIAHFTVTVTNLSAAPDSARLSFHVPNFTTYAGLKAGVASSAITGVVAPGATVSVPLD
ncbi:MAG TPA: hypothetical protein VGD78_19780, partial [Chthoniobacterales bacterium]